MHISLRSLKLSQYKCISYLKDRALCDNESTFRYVLLISYSSNKQHGFIVFFCNWGGQILKKNLSQFREGKEMQVNNHILESWERFEMSQSGYFRGKTCLLFGVLRYHLIGIGGNSNIVKINLQFCFCLLIDL